MKTDFVRVNALEFRHDGLGVVGTAVINNHKFQVNVAAYPSLLLRDLKDQIRDNWQVLSLIVGRQQHRVLHHYRGLD